MDGKKGKANGKSHPVNKKCTVELYLLSLSVNFYQQTDGNFV
jgi:hypothetical protein